ncbi:MAG: aminotransferase class V-fold PLP-dependent enzyme [Saprospiraceae bacterium]|nr:aminotransferase class V-fold PLP-dependent enzyme [Saprospiraceae bacterium]
MTLQEKMKKELKSKRIFELAKKYAYEYIDGMDSMDAFPKEETLRLLHHFDESLKDESSSAEEIITQLHQYGSPTTTAQSSGRYFGFVNGSTIPVSVAAKWVSDVWDQNGGLFYTSAINSKLEQVCETWLKDIFNLPPSTVAGFVSGTSTANLCAIAAARFALLKKQGWDVNENGLMGCPPIRIVVHDQTHSSIKKTLALLGLGKKSIEWIPTDQQGRILVDQLPKLDSNTLVILQAGNVNSGAFDNFEAVCTQANKADAWVHIDGAFGLWAAASKSLNFLTKGIEKASSWAVDGHKTLNTPYDCGIVLCKEKDALISSMQATGEYLEYSHQRDPILYTNEMSKRARAIELWATLKYLGKSGIDELVTSLHKNALTLSKQLGSSGFKIVNEVVFNQVLVACENEKETLKCLDNLKKSGTIWLGGSTWQGESVIRISVCSWYTDKSDIQKTIQTFIKARNQP